MNKCQKIVIPILIIAMFFMCIPKTEYAANTTVKIGDINGDGAIDSRDTLRILEHIAASTIPKIKQKHSNWILTGDKLKAADINGDGQVDSRDTLRELEYIASSTIPAIAKKHPDWKTYIEKKWTIEATGIKLDKTTLNIEKGKSSKLVATITPTNASNKVVTWSSTDTKIATVDGIGNVVGKNAGITIITATTKNGKSAKCEVKITEKSTPQPTPTKNISSLNIALSTTSVTYNGKAQTPAVTIKDGNTVLKNGTNYTLSYSRNINAGIALITITGKGNYTGTTTKTFNINKATYNMNNVKFANSTVTYDGKSHSIIATGVPAGVKVTYIGNGKTAVGTYTITAKFTGNNANYNIIPDRRAILTIKAAEKKYYVAKNGSDSNPGTTASKPLKTIAKGISKLTPGYTLVINSGTYYETNLNLSKKGTTSNPIKIVANGNVVIDGSGKKRILKIQGSENITIEGITFQNLYADDAKGILIEPKTSNIVLSNCRFNNIKTKHPKSEDDGASAIFVNGSSTTAINNITIKNCTLTNIGAGYSEAISVDGNCTNINITGVTVTYTNGLKGNIGICICGNYGTCSNKSLDRPRNVTISNCNVSNCKSPYDPGSAYGIYVDGGKDVTIRNNTVSNCEGGIEIGAEVKNSKLSGKETENIKVLNNTIKNCGIGAQIGGWDGKATVYNVLFDKNTLLNCGKNGGKAIEFSKCKYVTISNCKFNTKQSKWYEGSSKAKNVTKKNNTKI